MDLEREREREGEKVLSVKPGMRIWTFMLFPYCQEFYQSDFLPFWFIQHRCFLSSSNMRWYVCHQQWIQSLLVVWRLVFQPDMPPPSWSMKFTAKNNLRGQWSWRPITFAVSDLDGHWLLRSTKRKIFQISIFVSPITVAYCGFSNWHCPEVNEHAEVKNI